MAYDRASTVFSPDGRLFQVEYAREAVRRGTATVGVKFKDGVVFIVDKRIASNLIEADSIEKIFKIDVHIGCAISGLVGDARVLVDRARMYAQIHKITYGEPIPVELLAKKIGDFKQNYTQSGGIRPFGTALLIAGINETSVHLFETDPSGALMEYCACSIGTRRNLVMVILEESYKPNMSQEAAIELGIRALIEASEEDPDSRKIEIGLLKKGKPFVKFSPEQTLKYMRLVQGMAKKGSRSSSQAKRRTYEADK